MALEDRLHCKNLNHLSKFVLKVFSLLFYEFYSSHNSPLNKLEVPKIDLYRCRYSSTQK